MVTCCVLAAGINTEALCTHKTTPGHAQRCYFANSPELYGKYVKNYTKGSEGLGREKWKGLASSRWLHHLDVVGSRYHITAPPSTLMAWPVMLRAAWPANLPLPGGCVATLPLSKGKGRGWG